MAGFKVSINGLIWVSTEALFPAARIMGPLEPRSAARPRPGASRTLGDRGAPPAAATAAPPHPVLVPSACAGCGVGVPQGRRGLNGTCMRRRRHLPGGIARFVRRITLRDRRPSVSTVTAPLLRFCSRCPANAELFCGSSGGQSSLDEFLRGGNCVRVEWRSTRCAPAFPGRGDAVAGPLGDEPAFEVRDGAEDVEHEFAGRGRGVEALLEAEQVDAAGLEVVDGFEQLPE